MFIQRTAGWDNEFGKIFIYHANYHVPRQICIASRYVRWIIQAEETGMVMTTFF